MPQLVLALYTEGSTDAKFLVPLIVRVCEDLFIKHGVYNIEVTEPVVVNDQLEPKGRVGQAERILQAARKAEGFHALLVHSDADKRTRAETIQLLLQPGFTEAQKQVTGVCPQLLPVIPIQMIEAWMLADTQSLCGLLGVEVKPSYYGMPFSASQLEGNADPKKTLEEILEKVNFGRHRRARIRRSDLYLPLGRSVNLKQLERLSGYQDFTTDLKKALKHLKMLQ